MFIEMQAPGNIDVAFRRDIDRLFHLIPETPLEWTELSNLGLEGTGPGRSAHAGDFQIVFSAHERDPNVTLCDVSDLKEHQPVVLFHLLGNEMRWILVREGPDGRDKLRLFLQTLEKLSRPVETAQPSPPAPAQPDPTRERIKAEVEEALSRLAQPTAPQSATRASNVRKTILAVMRVFFMGVFLLMSLGFIARGSQMWGLSGSPMPFLLSLAPAGFTAWFAYKQIWRAGKPSKRRT